MGGRRFYVASGTVEAEDGVYHIPGSHEGLPVSQVEDITFVGNGTVLILGEGIEYIESGILGDNRHITSLVLPTTVEEIYSYAFSGTALEYVNFSAGLWNIGQEAFRGTPLKERVYSLKCRQCRRYGVLRKFHSKRHSRGAIGG